MTVLTVRQQHFVTEYLIDFDGQAAAIRAGFAPDYAVTQASRLLRKPAVKAALDEQIAARSARTLTTADWVIARLREEATFYGEGSSHTARVAALAQLAKHLGLHKEEIHISPVQFVISRDLSPAIDSQATRIPDG
jgi:phage terminase small subunit